MHVPTVQQVSQDIGTNINIQTPEDTYTNTNDIKDQEDVTDEGGTADLKIAKLKYFEAVI